MSQLTLHCFLFLRLLRCFSSAGTPLRFNTKVSAVYALGFPHSEISGSKAAQRLPEAYRSYATSFIAFVCQGIHHTPLLISSCDEMRLTGHRNAYRDGRDILYPRFHVLNGCGDFACFIVWNYQTAIGGELRETKTASRGLL